MKLKENQTRSLKKPQLATILQISEAEIEKLEKEGLPRMKTGHRTVRYDLEDVLTWMKQQEK